MRELTVVKIIIPFSFATFLCYCPHFKISRVYKRKVYYLIALSRMIFAAMFARILGLQPSDKAATLDDNTTELFVENFT